MQNPLERKQTWSHMYCTFIYIFFPITKLYFFLYIQGENLVMAVDDDGCFTEKVTDFIGQYVKEADKDIIQAVKARIVECYIIINRGIYVKWLFLTFYYGCM